MNDEPPHKHRKYYILALFAVFIAILGVILPEIEFSEKTYINASSIVVVGAASYNGSVVNLTDINNGYFTINESTGTPFYVIVNFTNVTNFSFLEVKAKYFSDSATPSTHIVNISIFCHTDMEYEDVFFMENSLPWRYFTRHFPDSEHFINNNNVSIKFDHTANGNANHHLWIDTTRLIILPQYSQSIINQYFNNTTGTGSQNLSQVISVGNDANGQNIYNIIIDNQTISEKYTKSGDNMTGSTRFVRSADGGVPNATVGSLSVVDINKYYVNRVVSFWTTNKVYNESAFVYENGTYVNGTATGLIIDSGSNNTALNKPPLVGYFWFEPQKAGTDYTYWFQTTPVDTTIMKGNLTITNQSGTGNAYPVRSNANGMFVVNRTAGAGITMKSPGGNIFCVTVSDAGGFVSTAGACS